MQTATTENRRVRSTIEQKRFDDYKEWERQQMEDPRFSSLRMLCDDVRLHGEVLPETWQRFDDEEDTWAAEVLDAPQRDVDRFRFDGRDIIVKETDGIQPRITLRQIYENGLARTEKDVQKEPGLIFQLQRDQYFMEFLEAVEDMMHRRVPYDTIHMRSTCPLPSEVANDPDEAARLLRLRHYNPERGKSFDYTARRLPNGQLELSVTTLDNSDLDAHQAVLRADGYATTDFSSFTSHEYGRFLGFANTTSQPIEAITAARAAIYDKALEQKTGQRYTYGRVDDTIEAHEFLNRYCQDHQAGYKAFHELLARHLEGGPLPPQLQRYLLNCLDSQEQIGSTVLSGQDQLNRLRTQLQTGKITRDMALPCRELLIYDHHATITKMLRQYKETGQVDTLQWAEDGDFLDAYADNASSNGAEAASNGETFDGCETATGVNSLETAAQLALDQNISLEEAINRLKPKRKWQNGDCRICLRENIKVGECRLCLACENAHNQGGNAALDEIARKALQQLEAQHQTTEQPISSSPEQPAQPLQHGSLYRFGSNLLEYRLQITVGGTAPSFITNDGYEIAGHDAKIIEQTLQHVIQQSASLAS